MINALGRLEPVNPRDVWTYEARDFTPWLLANAEALSEAVGMDLRLEAAEHRVGGFSLDLIGVDTATGDRVIVENQLEPSDHNHLGQILTYAGGTDPANVLWLATSFREEHRAALEWLNERTDEHTRFFGVRIEVVRIGTSPPAPLFTLVVQPNNWGKKVRASATTQRSKWTEDDFFSALMEADVRLADAARALFEHSRTSATGAWMYWGEGARPSMTAQIPAGSQTLQPWSFYLTGAPNGGSGWAINFEWIHKGGRGVDESVMEQFASRLAEIPGLADQVAAARAAGWRKRPTIPARTLVAEPKALEVITEALEELYRTVQERHNV
ncbi:hypothetical protein V1227_05425 [Lentzea sp. DG1S-22]|uniref:hypothetical protein n=1 Tax=Lentzea sp. DG1S-22 TaxID=3108822 RepID=UPI002E787212|nr:hypothetical protein [Lentzea sp. DG1S-22]WVH82200.1 hypothetical protein V1227_05425 [Lentzea sp. DG1S-22]